jgi:hypothetical protein
MGRHNNHINPTLPPATVLLLPPPPDIPVMMTAAHTLTTLCWLV